MNPLAEMRQITKTFGPVVALRGVDLTVRSGEVMGIVGDNGAGKSTLMKILTGVHQPDGGELWFDGRRVHFNSPLDSREAGIEMVYQDLALAENLTPIANIFLGRELTRRRAGFAWLDESQMARVALERIENLQIRLPSLAQPVERLSGGQRQSVAIARATAFQAKLVIMDEPAASLAVAEAAKVLALIRKLREQQVAVILISHRLQDVLDVADRIVVLNRGTNAGNLRREEATMERIVSLIVGKVL